MKKRYLLMMFGALFILTITVLVIFLMMPRYIEVPIATHTIRPWEKIESEDISYIRVEETKLADNVLKESEEILDRYVVAKTTIYPNSYFYEGMLEDEEGMKDGAYRYLASDEVAYDLDVEMIKINKTAITDGMNIDLYLTLKIGQEIKSDILFENALVLAKYDEEGKEVRTSDQKVKTFTIRIKRKDVNYLNKALALGEISAIISSEAYSDLDASLANESKVLEYLEDEDHIDITDPSITD